MYQTGHTYLIKYISPERGECIDVQVARTPTDALAQHLKDFPYSLKPVARVIGA